MNRVDFYVLSDTAPDARLRFVCRLAEKAVDHGHRVYVQTSSPALARQLDEMLWTFSDRSFVAHELAGESAPSHERVMVLLGDGDAPASYRQLLINLADRLPNDLDSFERIAEIVDADPERKRLSRERFRIYRDKGCTLETHNL